MLWVGTSWKMNGTRSFAGDYARVLREANLSALKGIQPFVIPSFTAIDVMKEGLAGTNVVVGAQNAHWEDSGAWTGEVSMLQAADAGATIIEMGHSERRQYFGETDHTVNLKVKAALSHGLIPLVCFGEPDEVFRAGGTLRFIEGQIDAALAGVSDTSRAILAYEPIWAIGDNGRPPRREDIASVFAALQRRYGNRVEAILYGGSVNHENNADILTIPGVGGLFIGRSAWSPDGYVKNLRIAASVAG